MNKYLILTLVISILLGIILPLALGVRDPTLIAICFSSVWFLYAVLVLITFLIKPGLRIKCGMRFEEGDSLVLQEVPPIATA